MTYDWVGQNTFNQTAFAGCRALQLLLTESLDFLKNLPLEVWQRWIPVILAGTRINQNKASYLELVKYAYLIAPEVFIKSLMVQINQENKKFDYLYVIERLDKCWNKQLKLALLEKVRDPSLKPKCVGQLLEKLLKQELAEAEDFAKSLITFPLKSTDNEREIALIASRVLVENSNPSSWPFIWAIIQQDSSFGRELLELLAQRNMYRTQLNLSETQLADLYIWLVHEYPYDEDPDHSDEVIEYSGTAEDNIARIRDNVRSQLVERGTLEACTQIQRLIQELPDFTWLGTTLIDAQANMRRKTWQPMTPEELLQFLISQEPSNSDLSDQIDVIEQRTKKMEREPKTETNIHFTNSPNPRFNAPVGTSGVTISSVSMASSDNKKGANWEIKLAVIGIIVTVVGILLSTSVSGAFNDEFKEWFNRTFYFKVEQQSVPKSQ